VARGFPAVYEVANRAEDRLQLGGLEWKDGIRCDGHEGIAAPVKQVHRADVLLLGSAPKAEREGQHGDRGGYD
jgi:hypothetical protein